MTSSYIDNASFRLVGYWTEDRLIEVILTKPVQESIEAVEKAFGSFLRYASEELSHA